MGSHAPAPELERHFGLVHATALNVTAVVGAGVFVSIPLMLQKLPGPYAVCGWLAAGVLVLADGLIWSELGAMLPGSGGSYLYLLEAYGRQRWGRLMAFLFIWQFLLSGPLEIASGLIAGAAFATGLSLAFADFDRLWTAKLTLWPAMDLGLSISPTRLGAFAVGVLMLFLLYRRITGLARLTVVFWLGVLAVIAWILIDGVIGFDPATAFDTAGTTAAPADFAGGLGAAMILAIYSYLGYYHVCYVGDEVRDPGKTIPRSILLSAALICLLFVAVHLALLGTVPWQVAGSAEVSQSSLPAEFMRRRHGDTAAAVITLLLIWSCAGAVFAALLGYARIPFGAARYGHFFAALGHVHPVHHIPHVALLLVGGLTLFWTFFDLEQVITALITTRILEQFVAQVIGVVLLRRHQPERPRPYRMWLYPLPCVIAVVGWLYVYFSAELKFVVLGLATLVAGVLAFVLWSWCIGQRPFRTSSGDDGKTRVARE
jgi:amino acid transporter